jgi:hypothetical protein
LWRQAFAPRRLHGIGEEGGGANLTNKLMASSPNGLPGTRSSSTPRSSRLRN